MLSPLARKTIIEINALFKYKKKEICDCYDEGCLDIKDPELCWFGLTSRPEINEIFKAPLELCRCPMIE